MRSLQAGLYLHMAAPWRITGRGVNMDCVQAFKGRVINGRLVVDEPTAFPEGTEIDLAIVEPGDDLDDEERAALHRALAASWNSAKQGRTMPADELMRKLRDGG